MEDETEPMGRARGGAARAAKLTPEERSAIARKGGLARKEKRDSGESPLPVAQHSGELKLGELSFPCAVLSDGTRVLTETDFMSGLGMYRSGALSVRRAESGTEGAQIPLYLAFKNLLPFVIKHLGDVHVKPLKYRTLTGGVGHGIQANLIPKICSVWMDARKAGVLGARQEKIADNAELLLRGLAEVGIVALVDEATGYQSVRAKDALATILEAFIAKELQPWIQTFPTDYYEQLFRLRGLSFPRESVKRPQYFGVLTNDIVYKRLAPGVLDELKRVTPRNEDGRPKAKYFQSLTNNTGYPKLREHLGKVVMMMQLSENYQDFKTKLDKFLPRYGSQLSLPLEITEDDGKGL